VIGGEPQNENAYNYIFVSVFIRNYAINISIIQVYLGADLGVDFLGIFGFFCCVTNEAILDELGQPRFNELPYRYSI